MHLDLEHISVKTFPRPTPPTGVSSWSVEFPFLPGTSEEIVKRPRATYEVNVIRESTWMVRDNGNLWAESTRARTP